MGRAGGNSGWNYKIPAGFDDDCLTSLSDGCYCYQQMSALAPIDPNVVGQREERQGGDRPRPRRGGDGDEILLVGPPPPLVRSITLQGLVVGPQSQSQPLPVADFQPILWKRKKLPPAF